MLKEMAWVRGGSPGRSLGPFGCSEAALGSSSIGLLPELEALVSEEIWRALLQRSKSKTVSYWPLKSTPR